MHVLRPCLAFFARFLPTPAPHPLHNDDDSGPASTPHNSPLLAHTHARTHSPFCYLGKRRLEHAIREVKDKVDVRVTFLPYQLNPAAPQEGVNKMQFYREKVGAWLAGWPSFP